MFTSKMATRKLKLLAIIFFPAYLTRPVYLHLYTEKSRVLKNTDVGVKVHYIRVTTTLTECN